MRRRDFITLLGGAAAAWPLAARAQPGLPVVGVLNTEPAEQYPERVQAFHRGLAERGFFDGRNVSIDYRWTIEPDRMAALAADLARRPVNVIACLGGPDAASAAKAVTTTIPTIFRLGGDPVQLGFVPSLSRPGGNLTGITTLGIEVEPKRFELMHQLLPAADTMAVLFNPLINVNLGRRQAEIALAAQRLDVKLHMLEASSDRELDQTFAALAGLKPGGLVITVNPFFVSRTDRLARLSVRHSVPAIFQYRDFAAAGGLLSYGGSITEAYYQVGVYVARILKSEKPADLPVQQVTKVEFIVNLKTANALGIEVPQSLLARADEVIE
jgi:putative ABC transport system substrate-binding protein